MVQQISSLYPIEPLYYPKQEKFNIIEKVIQVVIHIWFYFLHFLYSETHPSTAKQIFGNGVVCLTQNLGKREDLHRYARIAVRPIKDDSLKEHSANFGFDLDSHPLNINPFSGICLGGSLTFLKKWLQDESISQIAEQYKSGVPFEAAELQARFEQIDHAPVTYTPSLVEDLKEYIDHQKLPELDWGKASSLFEAINAFFMQERAAFNNMNDFVMQYLNQRKIHLTGKEYASFQIVADQYSSLDTFLDATIKSTSLLIGLEVEKSIASNHSSEIFLSSLKDLTPGAYLLALPTYNPFGQKSSGHAIALAIDTSGACHLFDSNIAIGSVPKEKLTSTVEAITSEYCGWIPKNNQRHLLKRAARMMRMLPNPPLNGGIKSGFSITRIKIPTP